MKQMEIKGSVAIVTGGNGGLGRRICHALAAQGATVAVVYAQAHETAGEVVADVQSLGGKAIAVQTDVSQADQVQRMVERVMNEYGRIDILVNDAAYNQWVNFGDLDALTQEIWDKMIGVNLTGPWLCMRAVAPIMRRQERGRIVNIASVAGLAPTGSSIAYAVSKAGLIHLTRCVAVALAPHILVNSISPGIMEGTRMTSNLDPAFAEKGRQGTLIRKAADKDDVADQVLTLVRSNSTTGQTICIDGGRVFH
jgi:3-oxoacyl-[acyl-carrier protein] reductase